MTAAAPTGGWCVFLQNPAPGWGEVRKPGQPLSNRDAQLIHNLIATKLWQGLGDVQRINPLAQTMVNNTLAAVDAYLAQAIAAGWSCDKLPNNPADWPGVRQPDSAGDVISGFLNWTGLGTVLGDTLIRVGVLVGILVLALIAIRRILE